MDCLEHAVFQIRLRLGQRGSSLWVKEVARRPRRLLRPEQAGAREELAGRAAAFVLPLAEEAGLEEGKERPMWSRVASVESAQKDENRAQIEGESGAWAVLTWMRGFWLGAWVVRSVEVEAEEHAISVSAVSLQM